MRADLDTLEAAIGHRVADRDVLHRALTHSSHVHEQALASGSATARDNEQLEFLGDSVLGFLISEDLLQRHPEAAEGRLSKLKAHLVSATWLHEAAQRLCLGEYLELGRGEEMSGGRSKKTLLVDALEALIAAIYLDGGLEAARVFILREILTPELERMEREGGTLPLTDFKSALQETLQGLGIPQPSYLLVDEAGPEHNKTFTVEVRLNARDGKRAAEFVGRAQGSTKKTAEQDAARQLLAYLTSKPNWVGEKPARARGG